MKVISLIHFKDVVSLPTCGTPSAKPHQVLANDKTCSESPIRHGSRQLGLFQLEHHESVNMVINEPKYRKISSNNWHSKSAYLVCFCLVNIWSSKWHTFWMKPRILPHVFHARPPRQNVTTGPSEGFCYRFTLWVNLKNPDLKISEIM